MWPCTQFYAPKGLILSGIWGRRFRPATEVCLKKDSPHCAQEKIESATFIKQVFLFGFDILEKTLLTFQLSRVIQHRATPRRVQLPSSDPASDQRLSEWSQSRSMNGESTSSLAASQIEHLVNKVWVDWLCQLHAELKNYVLHISNLESGNHPFTWKGIWRISLEIFDVCS